MDWSEALFLKAERWLRQVERKRSGLAPSNFAVSFQELAPILNWWCILISGKNWTLQEAETWAARDSERLFFPPQIDIFFDQNLNRRAYFYLACFLLDQDEIRLPDLLKWRKEFQKAKRQLGEKEIPLAEILLQSPTTIGKQTTAQPWKPEHFKSLLNLWEVRTLPIVRHGRFEDSDHSRKNGRSPIQHKKKSREQIEVLDQTNQEENENPLVHSFEKIHTTDDYHGGQKKQDGEDELSEQSESIEDLDLKKVVRTNQETKATLKGDFVMDIEVAASADMEFAGTQTFKYDEWDDAKGEYLKNWCTLFEDRISPDDKFNMQAIQELRRRNRKRTEDLTRSFYSLFKHPKWRSRQSDGPEMDLDSLVELMGTPIEKRPEKLNIYMKKQNHVKELSITLLFDRSLSSDSWVQNVRVLDTIRESLLVIGDSLQNLRLDLKVAAFSSQTRNRIQYEVLKDFNENWELGVKRLAQVEPSGYTRIGPAIRHASQDIEKRNSRYKWIILLSDSKPTDFDRYEGRYGVRDVRKAIQEAQCAGIGVRCLSIESRNRSELTEMFGPRGFEMLPQISDLPERLGGLLRSLVKKAK